MSYFNYKGKQLFCEDVFIKDVASKVKTPFYIYSYTGIVENFHKVKKAFLPFNCLICYSLKANSNIALCKILSSLGAGADIVSGGELYTALHAGFSPRRIVYAGVGKTPEEIRFALRKNILLFNVESEEELEEIAREADKLKTGADISIRINPDIDPETHHYITTGKIENKFGIPLKEAEKLYQKIKRIKSLEAKGVHIHIGSQIKSVQPYIEALKKVRELIEILQKNHGIKLTYLNIGGGFGIRYKDEEGEFPLEMLAQKITPLIPENMRLILEPGRYIMGNNGALVTRLLYRKKGLTKNFFIVDAGMGELIRPALYGAYHRVTPVEKDTSRDSLQKVNIVGPICESGDFFLKDINFPLLNRGELVAIMDTGAYGFSMSSNYNSRPKCAEVLVKKDKWWLIREREDYKSLLEDQRVPLEIFKGKDELTSLFNVHFWKMEGTGNDFIVIDNRGEIIKERKEAARKLCHRKRGIGADGLILIEEADEADFFMRTFNPDGSEAQMCGNGARCAVRFAYLKGITGEECCFKTLSGIIEASVKEEKVKIKMTNPSNLRKITRLSIDEKQYEGYWINTGVPHLVIFVPEIGVVPVKQIGSKIRFHSFFQPEGTNVDFVKVREGGLEIRTYERGVEDETLSCGTGAVASALVSAIVKHLASPIKVLTKGGEVTVWFRLKEEKFSDVFLEGEANAVYKGYLNGGKNV